jgi:biopolymer transport protein TolR
MAMGTARRGGLAAAINVTPMIDVLLVLLIIFMVVQQGLQKGISMQVPPPKDKDEVAQKNQEDQIVLEVNPGPTYAINTRPVAYEQLETTIREIYANRPRKIIFVKGAENLRYGDVVHAVDASRAAGVEVVGLVPRPEVGPATAAPAP